MWRLKVPLYGEADAGRIWHKTLSSFLQLPDSRGGMGFTQSEWDPCFYFRDLSDGSRMFLVIYVDDAYVVDNGSPLADALLNRFHDKWTITKRPAAFSLGNNISAS